MTDFSPAAIEARMQAAIGPQLAHADALIAYYAMVITWEQVKDAMGHALDYVTDAMTTAFEAIQDVMTKYDNQADYTIA